MATSEIIPRSNKYQDSSPDEFFPVENGKIMTDEWVAMIVGRILLVEPRQDGVLRYPPVQVDVERDPDFIAEYINMPPTDWSEIIHQQT